MRESDLFITKIEAERQPQRPGLVNSPNVLRRPKNREIAGIFAVITIFIGAALMIGGMLILGSEYWSNFPHSP